MQGVEVKKQEYTSMIVVWYSNGQSTKEHGDQQFKFQTVQIPDSTLSDIQIHTVVYLGNPGTARQMATAMAKG